MKSEQWHRQNIENQRSKYDRLTFNFLKYAYNLYQKYWICYPIYKIADWIRTRYWTHPCELYAVKYILIDHFKNGLPTFPQFTYPPTFFLQNGPVSYERLKDWEYSEEYKHECLALWKLNQKKKKNKKKKFNEDEDFELE